MSYSICAIICAAGKGTRAGFEKNKLLMPLNGTTVLEKTLSAFDFPLIQKLSSLAPRKTLKKFPPFAPVSPRQKPYSAAIRERIPFSTPCKR
jgi:2-C-methyl-D-erythritol 4-phosphate cytidylyltransferase